MDPFTASYLSGLTADLTNRVPPAGGCARQSAATKGSSRCFQAGEIPLEQVTASVQGWVNHVRYGNTAGLRKAVLGQRIG